MTSQKFHIILSKIHKWAGITIGIQVLLWIAGGLVMSYFPIEDVRGNHLARQSISLDLPEKTNVNSDQYNFIALDDFLSHNQRPIASVTSGGVNGQAVYKITYRDDSIELLDAQTAASLSPVSKDHVTNIATALYAGDGALKSAELLEETGIEYRGQLPVWRVDFDDSPNTSLYLSPETGELRSVRGDLWRFYDFMWMLHIMDYDTRDDFNHPLLYLFAFGALLFSLSGLMLAYFRFSKRDFKWIIKSKK